MECVTDAAPWPIPRPSWRARRYCATKLTDKSVAYRGDTLALAADRASAPSVRRRLRRLRDGHDMTLDLLVDGRLAWCPPPPWHHPVRLTADSATSDGGGGPSTVRPIPLSALRVTDATLLDPPGRPIVPGLETWTVTVTQHEGSATITGLLCDLTLLAAVAGWPAPEPIRTYEHAGAVGVARRPQTPRPPVRPLGWVLIALGVALLAGFVVLLAVTDSHHGGGRYGFAGLSALLVLAGWNLRRRRPSPGPDEKGVSRSES
jgi:hypothetical protein